MYYTAKKNKVLKVCSVLCCSTVLFLTGCATTSTTATTGTVKSSEVDPYEDFNRNMFSFNKALDDYVADPIVDAYAWVTPSFVQTGIGNFFSNLKDVNVILNDMMQAKFLQSGEDLGRFLLNSSIGLGGLFDIATDAGLVKHEEDFDQTFATWGIPQGPYIVLPILGPTTGRGIPGGILDTAANPASYVGKPIQVLSLLNERANADSSLKIVDEAALDPYVFTREGFLQRRKFLITDGKSNLVEDTLDTDEASDKNKADLKLDKTEFKHAADGFSQTEKSFNSTSQILKAASEKLEKLPKSK
jgi:phospholipid-binding lipoprotein MlaA